MKKLIVVLLLLAIPVMAVEEEYFLGKWICKDYTLNQEYKVYINNDTIISTTEKFMYQAKYNIMANDTIVLHYYADKAKTKYQRSISSIVVESKNVFYLPDFDQKFIRVKE